VATKQTYDYTTNRESLSDMISMLNPDETVIYSMIGKTKAKSTKHEWPEDVLAAAGANKHVEGASETGLTNNATVRSRLFNYTQIFKKLVEVSDTQEAIDSAGVEDELDYQLMLRMREIATDVEYAYVNSTNEVAGNSSTERELGGIQNFVTTNVLDNSGTTRFITESLLNDGLEDAWGYGGQPKDIVMSGANKRRVSAFTGGGQKNVDAKAKTAVAAVDFYDSDFGLVKFHANRFMPDTMIFGLDKSKLKTAYLRPFKREPKPKTSDSVMEVIKGELTLECRNEKAHFIIKDLKVS
jgi:hypothetical protein